MTGRYLTDLASVLAGAGLEVVELDGWQTRARSSGGYADGPWCVMIHHTASPGDGFDDAIYCTFESENRPLTNLVLGGDGVAYVCAAGGTNTNGKGGPWTLASGRVVAVDEMNLRAIGIELSNNGVGMPYPQVQIDALFRVLTALSIAYLGGRFDLLCQHVDWAPDRKIDPATGPAVQGPWRPTTINAAGSWRLADLITEARERGTLEPPSSKGDVEMYLVKVMPSPSAPSEVVLRVGEKVHHVTHGTAADIDVVFGVPRGDISIDQCEALLVDRQADGPSPFTGQWANDRLNNAWREP